MSDPKKIHTVVLIACIALIGFSLSFAVIAYTPLSNLIPGYPTAQVRQQQVQTAILIDSLEHSINRWEMYTENLRRVVRGESPIQFDSIASRLERQQYDESRTPGPPTVDSVLRTMVDEAERFEISDRNKRDLQIEGLHFFKPLEGYIIEGFSSSLHPYILVSAKKGSRVSSVLDGSVIFTCWTAQNLWSIVVQHDNGIISIYRNNESLLKKITDKVSAGGAIAILGDLKTGTSGGPALHFELWQNGMSLDPASYINF